MSERMLGLTVISLGCALPGAHRLARRGLAGSRRARGRLGDRLEPAQRVPRARRHRVSATDRPRRAHARRRSHRPGCDHAARRPDPARLTQNHEVRGRPARGRLRRVHRVCGGPVVIRPTIPGSQDLRPRTSGGRADRQVSPASWFERRPDRTRAMKRTLVVLGSPDHGDGQQCRPRRPSRWLQVDRRVARERPDYEAPNPRRGLARHLPEQLQAEWLPDQAGLDNSTTNTSSIPNAISNVAAFTGSDATWNAGRPRASRQTYADFDVQIVTERPASGNYHMAIVAGTPQNVACSNGVLGVSPFSCGYISNAVSFTFANLIPSDVDDMCWTVAQETAHSWGLDHKYDNRDPMTYLSSGPAREALPERGRLLRRVQRAHLQCNYQTTGNAKMNSYAVIHADVRPEHAGRHGADDQDHLPDRGPAGHAGLPVKRRPSPTTAASTRPSSASTARLIKTLESTRRATSSAPHDARPGQAQDRSHRRTTAAATRRRRIGQRRSTARSARSDSECTTEGHVCVDGHCVAGPARKAASARRARPTPTARRASAATTARNQYCVETCDPAANACPSGFSCLTVGAGGVCWPASGDGGGCSTNGQSGAPLLLVFAIGAMLITRKRRR